MSPRTVARAVPETLELPTGETVTPEDVFLYNGYPSRFVPVGADGRRPHGDERESTDGTGGVGAAGGTGGPGGPASGKEADPGSGEVAFLVAPLYWGDSGMDVPFRDREAFYDQWGPDSRGTLDADEWRAWLRDARADDRFGDEEVDALARELLPEADASTGATGEGGVVARLRRALGL